MIKRIIGWLLVLLPIIVIFLIACMAQGFWIAVLAFGMVATIIGIVNLGVYLIEQ